MDESKFLEVAKQAALEAGQVIFSSLDQKHQLTVKNGDSSDLATEVDLQAEEIIVKILQKEFPDHNILGEEQSKIKQGSSYTWLIDPIDGTFAFTHSLPFFAVSIGLLEDNQPIVGVIYQVSGKKLYFAQKSQGAYLNDQPIHVSKIANLENSAVVLDYGHRQKRSSKMEEYIKPLINQVGYPFSIGSAVSSQALVAEGILDAFVNHAWPWDFAAGTIIVQEAGGQVTDFNGQALDWTKERLSVVVSNGLVHDQIIEALQ